ncbi:EamA family transporter [Leadbetterella sp. DM7]|uniref:EamA family transporter n=1 Tax=Leadbetterella sp. DM7 TaxID=3235085 RepID=UPI00349EF6A9
MWWFYALLSAFFASLTAIFARLGVAGISSNLATGIRTLVILVLVWGIVWFKGEQKELSALPKNAVFFLVISGLATGLSWLFYFKALQVGNVSQVAAVDKLSVALTIVLAVVFLNETLSLRTAIGALLIIAGTFILIRS